MREDKEPSSAQRLLGDFSHALVGSPTMFCSAGF